MNDPIVARQRDRSGGVVRKHRAKAKQIDIFRRDGWLCRWCGRPVIFAPAMKYLERWARQQGCTAPLAWFSLTFRCDASPLLDQSAAVLDHVVPLAGRTERGEDTEANLVTACNKCNLRKNAGTAAGHLQKHPLKPIKGKYGEPKDWDGFSTLFVLLVDQLGDTTQVERDWYKALTATKT